LIYQTDNQWFILEFITKKRTKPAHWAVIRPFFFIVKTTLTAAEQAAKA
jgi:hypothetical protein